MSVLVDLHKAHQERLSRMNGAGINANPVNQPMMLARIQKAVARYYNISLNDMLSDRRTASVTIPRQIAMYLCKTLTPRSLPEIGRAFKGKDHTTVLHAVRKITEHAKMDKEMAAQVEELTGLLRDELSSNVDYAALETEVTDACRAAWLNAREIEGYRRHFGARKFLKTPELLDDLEKARDYLSRVLDDMRGVK